MLDNLSPLMKENSNKIEKVKNEIEETYNILIQKLNNEKEEIFKTLDQIEDEK